MAKRIAILGSTGSIGKNALRVIENIDKNYRIHALTAHSNFKLLAEQAKRYKPEFLGITNSDYTKQLLSKLPKPGPQLLTGPDSLVKIAEHEDIDILISAIVGAAGLPAILAAAKKGKRLAIANKEPLVIAGKILTETAKKNRSTIIPIDSEHSAIFQAMKAGAPNEIKKVIITSSGGPFRKASHSQIRNVTLEQTLAHPTWNMGPKITIDSATMMNKALEIIEAHWLFSLPVENIEVLIHPESIVHSLVEFIDGSVIAQLALPDMCLPIQYALTYPERLSGITKKLKLEEIAALTFEKPNPKTFRALPLGFEVAKKGGTAAAVFNAANEAAVKEFLAGRVKFVNIVELIEECLNKHNAKTNVTLEELLETDAWARKMVVKLVRKK